ncbi:MAG TPA: hypothetical protein PL070_00755, partial [Flavobacteriales bacterium]|nr:hypothetical protein [Flavobacteriales bacterium]
MQVTSPQGCIGSGSVNIALNAMPADVLDDVSSCITSPVTLNAGNTGSTYLWNTGATTQTIQPTASGTYTVAVTTAQNCSATFDAIVDLLPIVTVDLGPDVTICAGTNTTLDAGNPGATYTWSNGATSQTITTNSGGTYTVTVSN